ncbi:MAG: sulfatase-like hydrolase/transferase [candidate division WS1 bacterium]|jgi:arylsulfatase A-like enzyme|nr:sulfatase-like hydrolase/transferase [candidate division WS1 bacterium]
MNIILVAIDTLSARHMSCYGYHKLTTPNLDEFARQGALCQRLYCPSVPTQPNYTTTFTGQQSITTGIVAHGGHNELPSSAPYLTEQLQRAGYVTAGFDNLPMMKNWFARGWTQQFNPSLNRKYIQWSDWRDYNELAIPWLRENGADNPFFMFVHYWDPHTPYLPPEEMWYDFYEGDDPCDPDNESLKPLLEGYWGSKWKQNWFSRLPEGLTDALFVEALYDAEIRHVDAGFAQLMSALEDTGLAEDTMVVVFSDHGELMFRHGIFFDHHGLYDPNIHVPLLVRWPKRIAAGTEVDQLLTHLNLAPTMLEAAGARIPDAMEGDSALDLLTEGAERTLHDFLITQECTWQMKWAIRTERWKYIKARAMDLYGGPMEELYDLDADPGEFRNIAALRPDVASELDTKLEAWVSYMMRRNGLEEDPLVTHGITLGKDWLQWGERHGYW